MPLPIFVPPSVAICCKFKALAENDRFQKQPLIAEVQQCLVLALPLAAAQLAQAATAFVDTVMMGWLGSQTIASGGLGAATFTFFLLVSTSIVSAVSPLVAEAYGGGKSEQVGSIVQQGLWLSLLLGVPITLLLYFAGDWLGWLGQDANTVALSAYYLKAIAWGIFPALGFAVLRSFFSALSQPHPVMVAVVLGTLLNITLNYILMFGKLGLPALGLTGIGLASSLSLWSIFIGLAIYSLHHNFLTLNELLGRQTNNPLENNRIFWEIVTLGLPIGGLIAVEAGLFTVVTFLMGYLNTTALAAHQIALQTAAMSFQLALGVSLATTVRVGQLRGENNAVGVRRAGYVGIVLGGLLMGFLGIAFWLFPKTIISLYLDPSDADNTEVISLASQLLAVAAIFQIVDGVQVTAAGALRGLKDTHVPLLMGIMSYWCIGLVSGYVLGFGLGYQAVGLWWGLALGLAVAAGVLTYRFSLVQSHIQ